MKSVINVCIICCLIGVSSSQSLAQPSAEMQDKAQDQQVIFSNGQWIDVRSWAEYQLDHIDGDIRIHHKEIVSEITRRFPDKSTPINVYCASGVRSKIAADLLIEKGYLNIVNAGGIDDARKLRSLSAD